MFDVNILPTISVLIQQRRLTELLEVMEIFGRYDLEALDVIRYLLGGAK